MVETPEEVVATIHPKTEVNKATAEVDHRAEMDHPEMATRGTTVEVDHQVATEETEMAEVDHPEVAVEAEMAHTDRTHPPILDHTNPRNP
jgi:hypothetical protein